MLQGTPGGGGEGAGCTPPGRAAAAAASCVGGPGLGALGGEVELVSPEGDGCARYVGQTLGESLGLWCLESGESVREDVADSWDVCEERIAPIEFGVFEGKLFEEGVDPRVARGAFAES